MAIGAFGVLDPEERKGLAEAAEEGDEEALEELRADRVEAIEAMLGALEDPASRKLVELGMTLATKLEGILDNPESDAFTNTASGQVDRSCSACEDEVEAEFIDYPQSARMIERLDMVKEQLQMQLTILINDDSSTR
jgi:hypothetical protein